MVIIIRFFSICVISIFLLASCLILVLICHAQISSTRSTGPCTTLFAEVNVGQRGAGSKSGAILPWHYLRGRKLQTY